MAQFGYDGEPRDYSNPVAAQDIVRLSERLTAAGIEAGRGHDVTEQLLQPGREVIGEGESAHVVHRPEPPLVHFAVGRMAMDAPAAGIQHLVLSAEPEGVIILRGNQAAFNKIPGAAANAPGVPGPDTQGAKMQQYAGEAGWLVHDEIAHYIHAIERQR